MAKRRRNPGNEEAERGQARARHQSNRQERGQWSWSYEELLKEVQSLTSSTTSVPLGERIVPNRTEEAGATSQILDEQDTALPEETGPNLEPIRRSSSICHPGLWTKNTVTPKTTRDSITRRQSPRTKVGARMHAKNVPQCRESVGVGTKKTACESTKSDQGCSVPSFTYVKPPIATVQRVVSGQPAWVKSFELRDFLNLPWQKECAMEHRVEFISNYNKVNESTVVMGVEISLSVESLRQVFKLTHGNARIGKDSEYKSTNIENTGYTLHGYLVQFAKKHWKSRYEFLLPLLLLRNLKRSIARGVAEWVEIKNGVKDTAFTFHHYLHKELKRLQSCTAQDGRSLVTPIGPHLALLILGTDGTLPSVNVELEDESERPLALREMQLALDHFLLAQKTMTEMCEDKGSGDGVDGNTDDFAGTKSADKDKLKKADAELALSQKEVAELTLKCANLEKCIADMRRELEYGRVG